MMRVQVDGFSLCGLCECMVDFIGLEYSFLCMLQGFIYFFDIIGVFDCSFVEGN